MLTEDDSNSELKQAKRPDSANNNRRSSFNAGSYIVDYGPVRVRHRRSLSQTIATGRRSKDEPLFGEDAIKREIRRAKNRIAARQLKKARDEIELDLLEKIRELENEQNELCQEHKVLEEHKSQLTRAVYNAKLTPLIPLVADIDIPIIFGPQNRQDLLFDLRPLLDMLDEKSLTFDD